MNKNSIIWTAKLVCLIGTLVFALLQIFNVWDKANFIAIPLLAFVLIIQSIQEWKENRGVAIFSIIATIFILGCTVAIILL